MKLYEIIEQQMDFLFEQGKNATICKKCLGTGLYPVAFGEDDYAWDECECPAYEKNKALSKSDAELEASWLVRSRD